MASANIRIPFNVSCILVKFKHCKDRLMRRALLKLWTAISGSARVLLPPRYRRSSFVLVRKASAISSIPLCVTQLKDKSKASSFVILDFNAMANSFAPSYPILLSCKYMMRMLLCGDCSALAKYTAPRSSMPLLSKRTCSTVVL